MPELKKVTLPIRRFVEFVVRSGDIGGTDFDADRMREGAKAHRAIQRANAKLYDDYQKEVFLAEEIIHKDTSYTLEGRADEIYTHESRIFVGEIKATASDIAIIGEENEAAREVHWAQAQCYAYIYAVQNGLSTVSVRLTYHSLKTGERRVFDREFTAEALRVYVAGLLEKYSVWSDFVFEWESERDESIKTLSFPFPAFRKGQRTLAGYVYKAISGGGRLFAQAPTGIGKTISVIFPALKAMGEGKISKIFYLTAKTVARKAAEDAVAQARPALKIKTVTLTAKEKVCPNDKKICDARYCEYAKGHYDRVNEAVFEAITGSDHITREVVDSCAKKHRVCPFELSLDISLWADCVICDYNYIFDPQVYLRRFFGGGGGDYAFLIDEAHNLVDRSREMFSASLSKTQFSKLKKVFKGKDKALDKTFTEINKKFTSYRNGCGESGLIVNGEKPEEFAEAVSDFVSVCEAALGEDGVTGAGGDDSGGELLGLYFECLRFLLIFGFYDSGYVTYITASRGEVTLKLFCLDPWFPLNEALRRAKSAVLFSATLAPLEYFRDVLGGEDGDKLLALGSPFDCENLRVLIADGVSTRYGDRAASVGVIAELIFDFCSGRTGNYIIYFPSYKYMNEVYTAFTSEFPEIEAVAQEPSMTEERREEFLALFEENPKKTLAGFCVLGGVFSEGIDLKGSRLIGAVVVSVGLPQIGTEPNIIREYFDAKNGMGYKYAYMYPGMNKVLQAAGRVIRSESDRGAVLLIDERFGSAEYRRLFPAHWADAVIIKSRNELIASLGEFWGKA